MSDIAKWGLLVAGAVAVIALIFSIFAGFGWDVPKTIETLSFLISALVYYAGEGLRFGREMINLLFVPSGFEPFVTGVLVYLITRWFVQLGVKIAAWVYHYIFK